MSDSPLAKVVRDRRVNQILQDIRASIRHGMPISIAPKDIDYIRRSFHRGISMGEQQLFDMGQKLSYIYWQGRNTRVTLVILGRCRNTAHQDLAKREVEFSTSHSEIFQTPDTALAWANAPRCSTCFEATTVVASYMRFEPPTDDKSDLLYLFTRTKTTSNICYKIADMVFDIDRMFQRDKIYNEFSQVVTDIYGLKGVVKEDDQIDRFLGHVHELSNVEIIEEKDYRNAKRKRSGFEVYKLVIRKNLHLFEIQVQSKRMYDFELSSLSANHKTYKDMQMIQRRRLGKEYRDLFQALSQLFARPDENYCNIEYIELGYGGKGHDDEF